MMRGVLVLLVGAALCVIISAKSGAPVPATDDKPDEKSAAEADSKDVSAEARIMQNIKRAHARSIEMAKRGWWGTSHESKPSRHRSRSRYYDKRGVSVENDKRWRSSNSRSVEWPSREDYWTKKTYEAAWDRAIKRDKYLYQRRYGSLKGYKIPLRYRVHWPEPDDFRTARDYDRAWDRAVARHKEEYKTYHRTLNGYKAPWKPRW